MQQTSLGRVSLHFSWLSAQRVRSSSRNARKLHWNTQTRLYRCSGCCSHHHPGTAQSRLLLSICEVTNTACAAPGDQLWPLFRSRCRDRNIKSAPNFMSLFTLGNSSSRTSFAYLTRRTVGKALRSGGCCRVVFDSEFHKKVNTECVYMEWGETLQSELLQKRQEKGNWAQDTDNRAIGEEEGENASRELALFES